MLRRSPGYWRIITGAQLGKRPPACQGSVEWEITKAGLSFKRGRILDTQGCRQGVVPAFPSCFEILLAMTIFPTSVAV